MSKLSTEGLATVTTESRLQPVFTSDVLDLVVVGFLEGEVVDKPMER